MHIPNIKKFQVGCWIDQNTEEMHEHAFQFANVYVTVNNNPDDTREMSKIFFSFSYIPNSHNNYG